MTGPFRIRQAVFLDRDGVLNSAVVRDGKPFPPSSPAELHILPGVPEACESLRQMGFALVVVTNQPDIARGRQQAGAVEAINEALRRQVPLDAVYVCPHDDCDGCACRKPAPGLLLTAAHEYTLDLPRSFMVGDRWRDIEAGRRAGCRTILIDHDYCERRDDLADAVFTSLAESTAWIHSVVGGVGRAPVG